MDVASVPYMTVVALRKELRARGQETRGNKAALVDRLTALLSQDEPAGAPEPSLLSPVVNSRSLGPPPSSTASDPPTRDEPPKVRTAVAARPRSPHAERATQSDAAPVAETADHTPVADADDHPLSTERMRRRAKRFGLPWPPVEKSKSEEVSSASSGATPSTKRQSRGSKNKPAIGALDASDDEMARRAKRAKRFGIK